MRVTKAILISISVTSISYANELSRRTDESIKKTKSRIPALELLPAGSILKKLSIPRYNKDYSPASLLTAEQIEVINDQEITGTDVAITLYDKSGKIKTKTFLKSVNFKQNTGLITSKGNLTFSGDTFTASSQGLIIDWKNQYGFLLGKNQTIIYLKESKLMANNQKLPVKNKTSKPTTATVTKAATAVIISSPAYLTAQELAEIDNSSAPSTELFIEQLDKAKATLKATAEAETRIAAIRRELSKKLGEIPKINTAQPIPPELIPTKGKDFIRITSDRLMFDAKKGIFVYAGNVQIKHPKYSFTCDGELKVILSESAKAKKLKPDEKAKLQANDIFDDVSQIIALNNVIIKGKDNKGKPVLAVTQKLVYNKASGKIILKGKGTRISNAMGQIKTLTNSGYITLDRNLNASSQGRVETSFSVPNKNKEKKK